MTGASGNSKLASGKPGGPHSAGAPVAVSPRTGLPHIAPAEARTVLGGAQALKTAERGAAIYHHEIARMTGPRSPPSPSHESSCVSTGGRPAPTLPALAAESAPPPAAYLDNRRGLSSPGADGATRPPGDGDNDELAGDTLALLAVARARAPGYLGKMSGTELLRLIVHAAVHLAARKPHVYGGVAIEEAEARPDEGVDVASPSPAAVSGAVGVAAVLAAAGRLASRLTAAEAREVERAAAAARDRASGKATRDAARAEWERRERTARERAQVDRQRQGAVLRALDKPRLMEPSPYAPPATAPAWSDFTVTTAHASPSGMRGVRTRGGAGRPAGRRAAGAGIGVGAEPDAFPPPPTAESMEESWLGDSRNGAAAVSTEAAEAVEGAGEGEGGGPHVRPPRPPALATEASAASLPDELAGPGSLNSPTRASDDCDAELSKPRRRLHRPRRHRRPPTVSGGTLSPGMMGATFPAGAMGALSGEPSGYSLGGPEESRLTVMSDASFLLAPGVSDHDRRPWRLRETDTALRTWIEEREWRVRERDHLKNKVVAGDLTFLERMAARMRRRNVGFEKQEAGKAAEAAAKIQRVWLARSGSMARNGPAPAIGLGAKTLGLSSAAKPARTWEQVAADVHTTKFITFCNGEDPVLPSIPTLPCVIVKYVAYLHEENRLESIKQLEHYYEAINDMHREAKYDEPCVDLTAKVAYLAAVAKKTELVRSPLERRAPLHPRFVLRMLEVALTTPDDRVRRACAFAALSYQSLGNQAIFAAIPLNYFRLNEDEGSLSILDRDPSGTVAPPVLTIPFRAWDHRANRPAYTGPGECWTAEGRPLSPTPHKREISFRALANVLINSQHARMMAPTEPAFYLPEVDAHKPSRADEAAWIAEALKAAHAYPPGGEHFNAYSLRSGAASAAFSVGVNEAKVARMMGLYSDREDKQAFERITDALMEPTWSADFFFWHYRVGGMPLSEPQADRLAVDFKSRPKR